LQKSPIFARKKALFLLSKEPYVGRALCLIGIFCERSLFWFAKKSTHTHTHILSVSHTYTHTHTHTHKYTHTYTKGYRTLVIARRELSEHEFAQFSNAYAAASQALENRDVLLEQVTHTHTHTHTLSVSLSRARFLSLSFCK